MWMNRMEIDDAFERYRTHHQLGPVVTLLRDYRDEVDRKSDGWPHWTSGSRAAQPLVNIIHGTRDVSTFPKAVSSLRRFCSTHKLDFPDPDNLLKHQRRSVDAARARLALEEALLTDMEQSAEPLQIGFFGNAA